MICKYCKAELNEGENLCASCNKYQHVEKRIWHWLPLVLTVVALFLFADVGEDGTRALNVFNFNYTQIYIGLIGGGVSTYFLIPRNRIVLHAISYLIILVVAINWIRIRYSI